MLADVMNRKWRVGLLKKTPVEERKGGEGNFFRVIFFSEEGEAPLAAVFRDIEGK